MLGFAAKFVVTATLAAATGMAALSSWLPKADTGFLVWRDGKLSRVTQYDAFVCPSTSLGTGSVEKHAKYSFDYAGESCPLFKTATPFRYGGGEPTTGSMVYDAKHELVLFQEGCCAWRGFVLAPANTAPPIHAAQMDLSNVHTARGAKLGMTQAQVTAIYGHATPHETAGRPGLATLTYTTMRGGPDNTTETCGQFQSFFFRRDRLVSIELLSGC